MFLSSDEPAELTGAAPKIARIAVTAACHVSHSESKLMKRIPGTTKGPTDSLLPCPFCTADLEPFGPKRSTHPRNDCLLSSAKIDSKEYAVWNRRAVVVSDDAVTLAEDAKSSEKLAGSAPQLDEELRITELLEKLLRRLADPPPPVPLPTDVWDAECIARYMKRTADTVRREIVVQPTFPRPMRIPGAGRARALYKAREVVAWLESHQESIPAPRRRSAAATTRSISPPPPTSQT